MGTPIRKPKKSIKDNQRFAKKSLGQNFLMDSNIRNKILQAVDLINEKNILEIGPGLGFLTNKLLQKNIKLTAIELDHRAIEILKKDLGHKPNFHLIQGDILDQNLDDIFGNKAYSIAANIPYNITSPILKKILANTNNKPKTAILMMQKEVGEKLCSPQKNSILKISVDIFAEPEILFPVPRNSFFPVPNVDSVIVKLTIRKSPLVEPELQTDFFKVINAGFSQRRKKTGNYFGQFFGLPTSKLLGGIDPDRRAETFTLKEWIKITKNFIDSKNLL